MSIDNQIIMRQMLVLLFLLSIKTSTTAQNQVNMTVNQEAPVLQAREIYINTSPERVWEVLTHIENWGVWNERIKKTTLQEELKTGSVFTWKTNGSKIKSEIHTFNINRILGWSGKTFGARAVHNWYLEPTLSGTKVRVEESMEGWAIKLMKKKMNRKLGDDMQYWLNQLKVESEKRLH